MPAIEAADMGYFTLAAIARERNAVGSGRLLERVRGLTLEFSCGATRAEPWTPIGARGRSASCNDSLGGERASKEPAGALSHGQDAPRTR
jgi:hypothetical protein